MAGAVQSAILSYLRKSSEAVALTDLARAPSLRGVHFARIQKAAQVLARKGAITTRQDPREGLMLALSEGKMRIGKLHELLRSVGADPSWMLHEAETTRPETPEDDLDLSATPKTDKLEPPNTTGAGDAKHWDMYRGLQEKALKMVKWSRRMSESLGIMTEAEMSTASRRALKEAKAAFKEAVEAQRLAYRKISEFGSTLT